MSKVLVDVKMDGSKMLVGKIVGHVEGPDLDGKFYVILLDNKEKKSGRNRNTKINARSKRGGRDIGCSSGY